MEVPWPARPDAGLRIRPHVDRQSLAELLGRTGTIELHDPRAPGVEGLNSLALANAIMQSSFLGQPVDLPIDAQAYAAKLQEMIEHSSFEKVVVEREVNDFENSFQ